MSIRARRMYLMASLPVTEMVSEFRDSRWRWILFRGIACAADCGKILRNLSRLVRSPNGIRYSASKQLPLSLL